MNKQCVNYKVHSLTANQMAHKRWGWNGGYDGKRNYLSITFYGEFEAFNTRPYHNYETWGHGWFVQSAGEDARSECLECALEELFDKIDSRS